MWCENCQQDVPELTADDGELAHCAYCDNELDTLMTEESAPTLEQLDMSAPSLFDESLIDLSSEIRRSSETFSLDSSTGDDDPLLDWKLEEDLLQAEWLLGRPADDETLSLSKPAEFEAPRLQPSPASKITSPATPSVRRRPSLLAWTALLLGLTGFICGGVLLGMSYLGDRPELWSLGLPITLAGQVGLLIGVTLQLDRLRHDNRQSADQLAHLDHQLQDLQTTTLLSAPYQTASQSFYSHMVDGAGPQVLLTDLKSQLDLMAVKLNQTSPR